MKLFTVYSLNQNGHKEVVNHYETSRMAWSTCNFLNRKSKNQAVKESDELKTYCISHNFSMAESLVKPVPRKKCFVYRNC